MRSQAIDTFKIVIVSILGLLGFFTMLEFYRSTPTYQEANVIQNLTKYVGKAYY